MDTESLSYKTFKNLSYALLGVGWPILFSVFITPVVVHRLGITDYGVYILVNTVTGFLGLLDLGLTSAVIKYVSEYYAKDDQASLQSLLNAVGSLYALIGLLGLLIFLILGKFFLPVFHISGLSQSHIYIVFALAGLVFFVNSANSVFTNIPVALQRYDVSTKVNLSQLTFLNVAMLVLVLLGFKLKAIMIINLFSVLCLTWAYRAYFKKLLPAIRPGFGWDFVEIKKLYKFGIFAALTSITISSLNQLDRLIIPIFLGPAALSYYSLPGNVAQKTSTIVGSASGIFFPMASSFVSKGQLEKLSQIYRKIIRNLTVVAAAMATTIIMFGYQILLYWLGKDFANKGTQVLWILTLTYFILSLSSTLYNFLMGLGKVKLLAFWSSVFAVINLIFLVLLLPRFGIIGAAWAYLAGAVPVAWLFYKMEKDFLNLNGMGKFYAKVYAKVLFTSLVFSLLVKFVIIKAVSSLTTLILVGPACILLYLFLYKLFGFFEQEDWDLFTLFFNKILLKLRINKARPII